MRKRTIRRQSLFTGLAGALVGLWACAGLTVSPKSPAGYMEFCRDLIGRNISEVFGKWGHPDRTFSTPEGNTAYGYLILNDPKTYWGGMYQEIYPPDLMQYPPDLGGPVREGPVTGDFYTSKMCSTYFETDKNGRIVKIMWKGECRAEEERE